MNNKMIIGLAGLTFGSGNLGCSALAISFYSELTKMLRESDISARLISFSDNADTSLYIDEDYPIEFVPYHLSDISSVKKTGEMIKKIDYVIDFTEGDSFADLYGFNRFFRSVVIKIITIVSRKCLILGPQTYGPYKHLITRVIASNIINKSGYIYSRDFESVNYLKSIGVKREVYAVTDVAYLLPYKKVQLDFTDAKIKVGFNISGLLWDQCTRKVNDYLLKLDYKTYCERLIEKLLDKGYEVYLTPHVGNKESHVESDYNACEELHSRYPSTKVIDNQFTAIGIKNYISSMDIFIGSRMHSTIAAFSSGVFTIPVAYSKKFQGYYQQLHYPVIVDARNLSTEDALEKTLQYIGTYKEYEKAQKKSMAIAGKKLDAFYNSLKIILKERK